MEELRSTEILDKEIEADARKKAARIVAKAESEAKSIIEGVDERVKKAVEEKSAVYKNKLSLLKKNADAYIPLEKERFLVAFYDEQVCKAMNEYFNSIGKEKRLSLLENKLEKCKFALENKKIAVSYFGGLEEADARKVVEKAFAKNITGYESIQFEKSGEEAVKGNEIHEGMILKSDEKNSVIVRLTMDELVRELKDKYSYELSSTLFGGRLPE